MTVDDIAAEAGIGKASIYTSAARKKSCSLTLIESSIGCGSV